jgi:hypothetical protein
MKAKHWSFKLGVLFGITPTGVDEAKWFSVTGASFSGVFRFEGTAPTVHEYNLISAPESNLLLIAERRSMRLLRKINAVMRANAGHPKACKSATQSDETIINLPRFYTGNNQSSN